jgi:two-component system NarL family response regulator
MSGRKSIRVMIVDDHFMARLGLAVPINGEPDMKVVAEAADAAQALALYPRLKPDVVTLDARLPGLGGVETARALLEIDAEARLLMITAFDGEEDVHRALQAGVRGYLTKDASRAEVLEAIRQVHAGERVLPPAIAEKWRTREAREALIPREIAILRHIVDGRANKEIAAELGLSEALVKLHVRRILEKLGAVDRTRAATLAIERGIVHLGG